MVRGEAGLLEDTCVVFSLCFFFVFFWLTVLQKAAVLWVYELTCNPVTSGSMSA